jgi:YHS domain-containing protein
LAQRWKVLVVCGLGISMSALLVAAVDRSRDAAPAVATAPTALAAPAAATEAPAEQVRRVDPTTVCMVNDMAMGKPQIPVEVDAKTYYGCCEMCKQRLAQDEAVRYAVDPVTGARVDKAKAVIGERADGSVVYFESDATLARFGEKE